MAASFTCTVCLDTAKEPVVTKCGHLFCWPCLYRWAETYAGTGAHGVVACPVCKGGIDVHRQGDVIPLRGTTDEAHDAQPASSGPQPAPATAAASTQPAGETVPPPPPRPQHSAEPPPPPPQPPRAAEPPRGHGAFFGGGAMFGAPMFLLFGFGGDGAGGVILLTIGLLVTLGIALYRAAGVDGPMPWTERVQRMWAMVRQNAALVFIVGAVVVMTVISNLLSDDDYYGFAEQSRESLRRTPLSTAPGGGAATATASKAAGTSSSGSRRSTFASGGASSTPGRSRGGGSDATSSPQQAESLKPRSARGAGSRR
jgi:hypothetical protein